MSEPTLLTVLDAMPTEAIAALVDNMAGVIDRKSSQIDALEQLRAELHGSLNFEAERARKLEHSIANLDEQIVYWKKLANQYKETSEARSERLSQFSSQAFRLIMADWRVLRSVLDDDWEAFEGYIKRNRRIDAIKLLRQYLELGLKEAKDIVDHLAEVFNEIPF